MLYWAYGSNLSRTHMATRCPRAVPVGPLTVNDAKLIFRGVADVTTVKGSVVPGGLWEITRQCEAALDRFEGIASRVYMRCFLEVRIGGKKRDVLFYQKRASRGIMRPEQFYLDTIATGYRDFGLNLSILAEAVQHSIDNEELTEKLKRRYHDRGRPKLATALPVSDDEEAAA